MNRDIEKGTAIESKRPGWLGRNKLRSYKVADWKSGMRERIRLAGGGSRMASKCGEEKLRVCEQD